MPIIDARRANLRGDLLANIDGAYEQLAENDRLIGATAIARNYTLVTAGAKVIEQNAERKSLTIMEP